jgi:hypothetical protein
LKTFNNFVVQNTCPCGVGVFFLCKIKFLIFHTYNDRYFRDFKSRNSLITKEDKTMDEEQKRTYKELQGIARKEQKAEQAKIRRAARKWIQERYKRKLEDLDKAVAWYDAARARQKEKKRQQAEAAAGVQGENPPPPKGNEVTGTSERSIRCNTQLEGGQYVER